MIITLMVAVAQTGQAMFVCELVEAAVVFYEGKGKRWGPDKAITG